jgi:hypothetical protein
MAQRRWKTVLAQLGLQRDERARLLLCEVGGAALLRHQARRQLSPARRQGGDALVLLLLGSLARVRLIEQPLE